MESRQQYIDNLVKDLTTGQKNIITRMAKERKYYLQEIAEKAWDKSRRWTKEERARLCLTILAYTRPEMFHDREGQIWLS